MSTISRHSLSWQKALPYLLVISGIVGIVASFALTYDKIQLLQHVDYKPSCNLNPVLSCGSVMKTPQANIFDVPNTIIGLMAFAVAVTFGLVLLAGATFKRWLWRAAQLIATVGIIFMHYLFFEAAFRIHAICPWCFLIWMISIPVFFGLTMYNIREKNIGQFRAKPLRLAIAFIDRYNIDLFILWYIVLFTILVIQFWYYWRTLIPSG